MPAATGAVASGTPCLRHFPVPHPGRVLLYAAEDALHVVRRRIEGICAAAGCQLAKLDVQVITAQTLRLDLPADAEALERTVQQLKPRLLILDPFVRLHRIDENASGEVAPLLAYLRELQRRHSLSVLVVHHAKKSSGRIRDGQALRGSSEFHAWGDSNLYLRRSVNTLTLTIELPLLPIFLQYGLPFGGRVTAARVALLERGFQRRVLADSGKSANRCFRPEAVIHRCVIFGVLAHGRQVWARSGKRQFPGDRLPFHKRKHGSSV
ncbi:MAG: AAA family ATPase [Steroidobacteraceae bacterium]